MAWPCYDVLESLPFLIPKTFLVGAMHILQQLTCTDLCCRCDALCGGLRGGLLRVKLQVAMATDGRMSCTSDVQQVCGKNSNSRCGSCNFYQHPVFFSMLEMPKSSARYDMRHLWKDP